MKQEEHKNIRELEEELIANLRKAEFLIAINANRKKTENFIFHILRTKMTRSFSLYLQMLWNLRNSEEERTSVFESNQDKLPGLMIPQASAYVVNPLGFNLILNKEQVEKIAGVAK